MPKFFFDSFTSGSAVAFSASQGAFTESGSVSTWGQTSLASVSILREEPGELVAPVGIWFEADQISGFAVDPPAQSASRQAYDETAHAITWIWDFDDPGTFEAPLNIPPQWNNKSVGYGKKVYHVFDTPGTYTVGAWGIDRTGITGEDTVTITVQDPDQVYSGIRTICVSNQGDFTGAPAGANLVTSLSAARSAANSLGQTGRILLRRGESFQETMEIDDPMRNCRIGAFGSGAKPVLRFVEPSPGADIAPVFTFRTGNQVADSVFYSLRFEGEWDAATETGDPRGRAINYATHNSIAFNTLIYQCEADGMGAGFFLQAGTGQPYTKAIVDCDVTNWQDYGVWFGLGVSNYNPDTRGALVGCSVHQKQDACRGGQGKIGLGNDHGPLRHVDTMNFHLSSCDLYSANSWVVGVQPCLRLCQANSSNPGGYFVNVDRVVCEGGDQGNFNGQNSGTPDLPGNHVIDKFLFVSDYSSLAGFTAAYGGTTLRNGLVVRPNMNYQIGALSFLNFEQDNSSGGNNTAPLDVYNVTMLNLDTQPVSQPLREIDGFLNFNVENNIIHEPNLAAPNTSGGPIDLSTNVSNVSLRNRGERTSVEKVQVSSVSVSNNSAIAVPYPSGTSAADFSTNGRHTVFVGGNRYFSYRGECSLSFGASNITVTNTSGDTWAGDLRMGLHQETLTTNAAFASPTAVPLPIPQSGSTALVNDGGYLSYTAFLAGLRDGPWKGAL